MMQLRFNNLGVEQRNSNLLHPAWFCKHWANLSQRTWGVCVLHNLPSKSEMYRRQSQSNAVKTSRDILKSLLWHTGCQCSKGRFCLNTQLLRQNSLPRQELTCQMLFNNTYWIILNTFDLLFKWQQTSVSSPWRTDRQSICTNNKHNK